MLKKCYNKQRKGLIKANITTEELLRAKIIKLALLQLNKEYVHGNMGPDTFDCAGLVWYVYNKILGINIFEGGIGASTTTMIMTSLFGNLNVFEEDQSNKDLGILNDGDILFFHRQSKDEYEPKEDNKYPGHCGIYLGNNEFIHCTRHKKLVRISKLEEGKYWYNKLVGSKNIIKK